VEGPGVTLVGLDPPLAKARLPRAPPGHTTPTPTHHIPPPRNNPNPPPAVYVGGGREEWRTCAMRDDEPRPVWTSLPITQ